MPRRRTGPARCTATITARRNSEVGGPGHDQPGQHGAEHRADAARCSPDSSTLCHSAVSARVGEQRPDVARARSRPSPWNALTITVTVGMIRKHRAGRPGTAAAAAPSRARPLTPTAPSPCVSRSADRLGPVVRQVLRRPSRSGRRSDGHPGRRPAAARRTPPCRWCPPAPSGRRAPAGRRRASEQVLALVAVEELLPQPRRGRMRGVLVDRLVVVAGDRGVRRDDDLPGRQLLGLGGVEVVPVDDDRRLAGLDGRRGRVDRQEVAGLLELAEELDARARCRRPSRLATARPSSRRRTRRRPASGHR